VAGVGYPAQKKRRDPPPGRNKKEGGSHAGASQHPGGAPPARHEWPPAPAPAGGRLGAPDPQDGRKGEPRTIKSVGHGRLTGIDFGLTATAAVSAPRIHHQHLPDEVVVEDEGLTEDANASLEAGGYKLVWGAPERILAGANAIVKTQAGWTGAVDPRSGDGAALGDL